MVSEKKKAFVQRLTQLIQSYPVIALINLQNLPTKQLQNMKAMLLKKDILISMTRKRLMQLALKNSQKPNIDQLSQKMKGMPALLLSKENPFTLCSILQKNKSSAPAKQNQISPKDIIVPAGPTNFAPGPIISELASVGIKTKVEEGKLTMVQDTVVAKEGETISSKLAEILKRLDIQPMEVGLDLVAAWENNLIFDAKQLAIDETEYFNNITQAFQEALNLAVEIAYPTADTIKLFLQKAFQESKTLALEQNILTDLTAEEILSKTEQQALSLKEAANLETPEKKEVKEEPQEEQKPEEPKVEETPEEKPKPEPQEAKKSTEEVKEEPKAEEKKEEQKEKLTEQEPIAEEPKESEEPQPIEEEKPTESQPSEEPEEKEQVEKEKPAEPQLTKKTETLNQEKKSKEDIPSAEDMIKAIKEKFSSTPQEKTAEVVEIKPQEPKPTAEKLIAEEKERAGKEKPKPDKDIEEAESLFEKLKKQGTLRE